MIPLLDSGISIRDLLAFLASKASGVPTGKGCHWMEVLIDRDAPTFAIFPLEGCSAEFFTLTYVF